MVRIRLTSWRKIRAVIRRTVEIAEELFDEPGSGDAKKAFVVDFINDRVDIPLLTERQEGMLLELAIDLIVDQMNEALGK